VVTEPAARPPGWATSQWFNAPHEPTLEQLRGRVVVMLAFQMLCPGCVSGAIPQARAVVETFAPLGVEVLGLHTVFEHHAAMTPVALAAFLHEYRITFPVGVDLPGGEGDPLPVTMRRYRLQGTPTFLLFGRDGRLARQLFGHVRDLRLGAEIMALVLEAEPKSPNEPDGTRG
jgi:thiol-disulfide isomerase/thioredoxin